MLAGLSAFMRRRRAARAALKRPSRVSCNAYEESRWARALSWFDQSLECMDYGISYSRREGRSRPGVCMGWVKPRGVMQTHELAHDTVPVPRT